MAYVRVELTELVSRWADLTLSCLPGLAALTPSVDDACRGCALPGVTDPVSLACAAGERSLSGLRCCPAMLALLFSIFSMSDQSVCNAWSDFLPGGGNAWSDFSAGGGNAWSDFLTGGKPDLSTFLPEGETARSTFLPEGGTIFLPRRSSANFLLRGSGNFFPRGSVNFFPGGSAALGLRIRSCTRLLTCTDKRTE